MSQATLNLFRSIGVFACIVLNGSTGWTQSLDLVAGGGTRTEDGIPAREARLIEPFAGDFDSEGNLYIGELDGGRVMKVTVEGMISRIAGAEEKADRGDGDVAENARFNGMHHLLLQDDQNLLIADTWNQRIRRIDLKELHIFPFAGQPKASSPQFEFGGIYCLAFNKKRSRLYFVDLDHRKVHAVEMDTKKIIDIAGNGEKGLPTDGARAIESPLVDPRAVAVDSHENVYIVERGGHALRVVNSEGIIRTVAGAGKSGPLSDGKALQVTFNGPKHACVDAEDNVLIADTENHAIRKYIPAENKVITIAGNGRAGSTGLRGLPREAALNRPHGVFLDSKGIVHIADSSNGRIVRILP